MSTPSVSVVIASRNRPDALERCLGALALQAHPPDDFEVIVVDDGSEIPYGDVESEGGVGPRIRLLRRKRGGPGAARNTGVAAARGRLVLFTDDDCLPHAAWVATLVREHGKSPEHVLGGCIVHGLHGNLFSTASQLLADFLYGYFNRDPADGRFFTTNNLTISRELFDEVGGFDETIPVPTSEDRELRDRLLHRAYRLRYVQDAVVTHTHPLGPVSFWRQHFGYGRGAVYYRRRRLERGQEPVQTEPLAFYIGMLVYPFEMDRAVLRAVAASFLIAVSQLAVLCGYAAERWWFRGRPGWE